MLLTHGMKTEGQNMQMRFKYVVEDVDRYGNIRLYVRVPGRPKVRLRAKFGTDEFVASYTTALDGHLQAPRQAQAAKRGSFRHLCIRYYASATFDALDRATQSWRRRALDAICVKHADKPTALMLPRHVRQLRDELKSSPGAANQRLKALKALFAWACEDEPELAPQNPTLGVKKIKYATRGHHSWNADEVEQFRAKHLIGSKARLAAELLLYTGGRREDAVRLGPQHVRNGRVRFVQAKNEHRAPIEVDIPLHPKLGAAIAATRSEHLTFLVTEYGKPYTPAGFGNAMRDWCDQANLHHCSAHGLRKACATALAEAGATAHEIASVTGHQSLEEIERYTRDAKRKLLADRAMKKFKS
jgi:integrase/recombinase XerD